MVDKFRKKLPTVGNLPENSSPSRFLLCSLSFPQSLRSHHLPCLLSVFIHWSGHVSPFIYPLYFLSSHFARTQACMHILSHTQASEMRTSRGTGVGVSRWKEANMWLDDWVIERVKGQSSKAVCLYIAHADENQRWDARAACRPNPAELGALDLASSFKCTVIMIIWRAFMRWGWQMTKVMHQSSWQKVQWMPLSEPSELQKNPKIEVLQCLLF